MIAGLVRQQGLAEQEHVAHDAFDQRHGVVAGFRHDDGSAPAPLRPGVVVFAAEVDAEVAGGLCMGWV